MEEGEEGERTGGACEGGEGKGEKMEKREDWIEPRTEDQENKG